ncbi:response regulator [Magnetovibrio blakemorei]|uniref:DNA-binding response regulator n=1 Tax=Magnetovibrio blakemorei TaxID=28181 RepID=A0A1E5Q8K0_9PROT|nr:response regulator [Magnetovibrio blakemorei]OEJ67725.1 DNA-binding response regulator [Magnetovibrio blakemorei]
MRILLAEDNILLGKGIEAGLAQAGFAIDWVYNGEDIHHAVTTVPYDAIILDLGLPKIDGMTALRQLRATGNGTPVLILTARDSLDDRVDGLDAGSDDYMVKPFELAELQARLRALVRRSKGITETVLQHGPITLTPSSRKVFNGDIQVSLSDREFMTLQELMLNAGKVLSKTQLEDKIYGWGEEIESNTIEVYIHYLRKKLYPELIQTVRGVGYVILRGDDI